VDVVLDGSYGATGKDLDEQDADPEQEAIHDGGAYPDGRTHGEGQTEDGVLAQYAVKE
jgi:hypothetical protein